MCTTLTTLSEELSDFQISLSSGTAAKVTPKIASDVFASIAYIEDASACNLAARSNTHRATMHKYTNPSLSRTPNLNKAVHMLKLLGYTVYLQKDQ